MVRLEEDCSPHTDASGAAVLPSMFNTFDVKSTLSVLRPPAQHDSEWQVEAMAACAECNLHRPLPGTALHLCKTNCVFGP